MLEKLARYTYKAVSYCVLPFQYPGRATYLIYKMLTNRMLVRELVEINEQRLWYRSQGFRTVLDVGAYIGAYAFAVSFFLPKVRVLSFEPLPENIDRLKTNLAGYQQFKVYHTALGEKNGNTTFYRSSFSPSSSILRMGELHRRAFPKTSGEEEVRVPIARLEDVLADAALEGPVLLKLDVQGYEKQVLAGAGKILERIDVIICEVSFQPLYEGQALFEDMRSYLREMGFIFAGTYGSLHSPIDGNILQADAIFMKQELRHK
jgi:FkbM family methyltransferase